MAYWFGETSLAKIEDSKAQSHRVSTSRVRGAAAHLPYSIAFPSTVTATYFPVARSRNCTTRCPCRASCPHRLGFSAFCSIAWYSFPAIMNRTVRNRLDPVRVIGHTRPSTATWAECPAFRGSRSFPESGSSGEPTLPINCSATDRRISWSSMSTHPFDRRE